MADIINFGPKEPGPDVPEHEGHCIECAVCGNKTFSILMHPGNTNYVVGCAFCGADCGGLDLEMD